MLDQAREVLEDFSERASEFIVRVSPKGFTPMFVDAGIPDLTGLVVACVRRLEKLTVECRFERLNVHRSHKLADQSIAFMPGCGLPPQERSAKLR
jgi:hypothetical protein